MICIHCNQEHPDDFMFCPKTGAKIEPQLKACTNEECRDYGKRILPMEAKFCPRCGQMIKGQESSEEKKNTNKTSSKKEESDGYINGHEYVDLGLPSGLKWATCNVGADSPEEYGDYYAWGETYTKDEYKEDNCDLLDVEMEDIGGDPEYDVATSEWGDDWRLPTKEDFDELVEECEWRWMKKKGVYGMRVKGPNGNSIFLPATDCLHGIFLPAALYRFGSSLDGSGEYGDYWSSSPDGSDSDDAYYLHFDSGDQYVDWGNRCGGRSVRPVTE